MYDRNVELFNEPKLKSLSSIPLSLWISSLVTSISGKFSVDHLDDPEDGRKSFDQMGLKWKYLVRQVWREKDGELHPQSTIIKHRGGKIMLWG